MGMTSRQILDLAGGKGGGLERGAALFQRRQGSFGLSDNTPAQQEFLSEVQRRDAAAPTVVKHPAKGPRVAVRGDEPLTASELAWLQRFPSPVDPTAVSFEDAQVLASLATSITKTSNPGDARLVESIWAPVREHHDRREAEAALENARRPLPTIPSAVVNGLHDAVTAEVPQLAPHEVAGRVNEMLADLSTQRQQDHDRRLTEAEKLVADVAATTESRTRVIA